MQPLIGITCNWQENEYRHTLTHYYINAVEESGGVPILLPTSAPSLVDLYYNIVDGILFSGGADIDPKFFNEEPIVGLGEITPDRDIFEISLAKKALSGNKPVLAICRGIQVLNIAAGGNIYQDIVNGKVTNQQHMQIAPRWYPTHQVYIAENCRLRKIFGKDKIRTNSFHHQAIRKVSDFFVPVAWTKDDLVEAIEFKEKDHFIIGVQWHPECCVESDVNSLELFKVFIDEAKKRKGT